VKRKKKELKLKEKKKNFLKKFSGLFEKGLNSWNNPKQST